ncbi:hypothetical protein V8J88_07675 [Massilia sp. W12]|uniref:hypothetical protein n=1 Tax=Massilia sp. W12 TaxID=3126507 RepID=UPI0030CFE9D1
MENTFIIDVQQNRYRFGDDGGARFGPQWAALFLALLIKKARSNQDLTLDNLTHALQRHGYMGELTRMQLGRIVAAIEKCIENCTDLPIVVKYGSRNKTVGPWKCEFTHDFAYEILSAGKEEVWHEEESGIEDVQAMRDKWRWPLLLKNTDMMALHELLQHCLISDAFAHHGNLASALDTLPPVYAHNLSKDGLVMLKLRESLYWRRIGNYCEARALIKQVLEIEASDLLDFCLQDQAKFLLDRIDYDEAPALNHEKIWEMGYSPTQVLSGDTRTIPEWHNLRALLARRRLQALASAKPIAKAGETISGLHQHALLHLESAIYCALCVKDWERLQAYVANLAFHLQSAISYHAADVAQVFSLYVLTMSYTAKLHVGEDTAWEYIFLGEFWLDYREQLENIYGNKLGDVFGLVHEQRPDHEDFYLVAIERLRNCADHRQQAIAWINYYRFACIRHLPAVKSQAQLQIAQLCRLEPELRKNLEKEGYEAYLLFEA